MTYKEFKQYDIRIPKGWRQIRLGEKLGRKWRYSFYNHTTEKLIWSEDIIDNCYNLRLDSGHIRHPNTLYITMK